MSFDDEDMLSRELSAHLFTQSDLIEARRKGHAEGKREAYDLAERSTNRAIATTVVLVAFFIVAGILQFQRQREPGHRWVELDGQTCVQVPHPDFDRSATLIQPDIVLCQRPPEAS